MSRIGKQVKIFDENSGKVFSDTISFGSQNGDGWVIMYREALDNLAINAPLVAWKVFAFLSSRQEFDDGINTTKQNFC